MSNNDNNPKSYESGNALPPVPKIESKKSDMEAVHWICGLLLFLVPTVVLWILRSTGYRPSPCKYYGVWLLAGALLYGMAFCVVQMGA